MVEMDKVLKDGSILSRDGDILKCTTTQGIILLAHASYLRKNDKIENFLDFMEIHRRWYKNSVDKTLNGNIETYIICGMRMSAILN